MRFALAVALAPVIAAGTLPTSASAQEPFRHHLDHVLGTSLDLAVAAPDAQAARFRDAVLAEIDRLDAILSRWRPDSPVTRLSRGATVADAPADLLHVLELADTWRIRSGGAFDVRIGAVEAAWRAAADAGRPPTDAELSTALAAMRASNYAIDRAAATITPSGSLALAIDGVAKGFVIDRALAAARAACPEVQGAVLDIGGDAAAFGSAPGNRPWRFGIADPTQPADNAPLLAELELAKLDPAGRAIATSGGYARGYRIGGVLRSHILDPGTGAPSSIASATVIAGDAATADALATTLCVLGAKDGLEFAARYAGIECLIIDAEGRRHGSPGFAQLVAAPDETAGAAPTSAFPGANRLEIALSLPKIEGRRYERPYVAVWIEDAGGNHVRSLALWGRERRWVHELTKWWRAMGGDETLVDSISRASRGPGEYRVTWDGRDALGLPVPPGDYTVAIEVAREHGGHTTSRAAIACKATPATAAIPANGELAGAELRYGSDQDGK